MADEQNLMSDVKYKQFIAAIDKSLKSFEYSNEWADLISCLGKLNKVILTYKQYSVVPRKLLIGKRLAQCLHPALPSGVHLKALESYDLILTQIGPGRLAQDLFIYSAGLFPLLSQVSVAVKPALLDLYETHLIPLKKKLYPGLSGLLLALLPGIEEVSEYTGRTNAILLRLCESIDEKIFFSCLWDGVLHSSQTRLSAMTFVIGYISKVKPEKKHVVMGADVKLMVNAVCASFDDSNVLVQRITLDFAISFISFHSTTLPQNLIVKLLTYALGVLLRRDMSLNRRVFHWLLNVNSEGNPISLTDRNSSTNDQFEDETDSASSYFDIYAKEPLTAALISLFQGVVENVQKRSAQSTHLSARHRSIHLKPFRILITLLDKPEVGSAILEDVMLEVFRTLYKHSQIKNQLTELDSCLKEDITHINEELIKNANLLFNSFEPFFMWDYLCKVLETCSNKHKTEISLTLSLLVYVKAPTYNEIFKLISYLLDIVSLEISMETQSEHWPNLLKQTVLEMIDSISEMDLDTILEGISLMSKLLSRLSPNLTGSASGKDFDLSSSVLTQTSPPMSPVVHELLNYQDTTKKSFAVNDCVEYSKILFAKFVKKRLLQDQNMLVFNSKSHTPTMFSLLCPHLETVCTGEIIEELSVISFQKYCRYLVQLSCFPIIQHKHSEEDPNNIPEWLQVLIASCCCCSNFDMQASAIATLLDLIDVTLTVRSSAQRSSSLMGHIVPIISDYNLRWIEKSNLFLVLAKGLWLRITPETCQWHQGAVNLFLHLHNVTAKPNICEDVINNSLVDFDVARQEVSHWRFSVMWHLSREFYKDDNNKSNISVRTIDKCMLLMIDSLQSPYNKVREHAEQWLSHSVFFGDIGRILESILLILLDPTSARVAIHYAKQLNSHKKLAFQNPPDEDNAPITFGESLQEPVSQSEVSTVLNDKENKCEDDEKQTEGINKKSNDKSSKEVKTVPTHPLLIHKLLYTQRYDTQQCLHSLRRILVILKTEGRSFICAAATTSMSVCNTPHQTILRQLLIRHKRGLSGNDFYGSLAESHQLLIRASTAKYLEILLSVCLYFIRSEFHEIVSVTPEDTEGNFAVQNTSAEVLTQLAYFLLDIASDSGKGFSSYISDLLTRSKIQRIILHCLLSTVYAVTGDYREMNQTGYYSMVEYPNLCEHTATRKTHVRSQIDFQRNLMKLVESLIHLEFKIGTENVAAQPTDKKSSKREKNTNVSSVSPFEYIQFKPIVSQPMFISATLTVLREKRWTHLHDNWIKLLISCLSKFSDDMSKVIVPVVAQLCVNLKSVTDMYSQSYGDRQTDCSIQLPADYMLTLLHGMISFCHYCLIGTSTSASVVSSSRQGGRSKDVSEDPSSSLFSNLVYVFSASPAAPTKPTTNEGSKALSDTRDGVLAILSSILTAVTMVWKAWDSAKMDTSGTVLISKMPLAIGQPKAVRLSILQLMTPIAMHHTVVFLTSVADVWCACRDTCYTKPLVTGNSKNWLSGANKKFLPDATEDQAVLLEIVQAIKAMSLEMIVDTCRQVLRQLVTMKDRTSSMPLDAHLLHFIYELLLRTSPAELLKIKPSLVNLLKEGVHLNLHPPSLFVLFAILNTFVQRVPVPEERRARRDLQEMAQKFLDSLNSIAAASLEGSVWFRRSLHVVAQLDHSSDLEDTSLSDRSPVPESIPTSPGSSIKNSQYSAPALLLMAEYLAPMLDMLYLSEEKDKIASALVYLMYNVTPYLKNHSAQNTAGYRACSALLAAISDYQYTLRAWRKDVYELFLDTDFFQMDLISFGFWKIIIDRLITYDNTAFKDLMQKIALSQSGAINIFANREQEMEQRAQLLKRLSFAVFCGEFDQYHQYLPDIQERLAESIRQLQGPSLHEQVFLTFRVLLTRMSPSHLVSLWPSMLTELVLVFVHMEHEISTSGKPKSKSKIQLLESFLGMNGYFKDPNKWLRLYLAVCKLLDYLLVLPSDVLPYYQVYKWAFSETPGVYFASEEDGVLTVPSPDLQKKQTVNGYRDNKHHTKPKEELSKMALLNSPIVEQKKHMLKEKRSKMQETSKQENITALFVPYISRIIKGLRKQNLSKDVWQAPVRLPGQLMIFQKKVRSIYDLIPFFLGVTGELASYDVDVSKFSQFRMADIEELIEADFVEHSTSLT